MHSVYLKGDKQNASELQQVWFSALAHCLVNCKLRKTVKKVKSTVEKKAPKLRKNIQPGQILILLASKFRGKRVVFLKQLESGLLLVTGPFALNGVPLKRVNQRYCIATSTKVDLGGADFKSITDSYFAQEKTGKKGLKGQEKFFAAEAPKKVLPQEKKDGQKKTDDAIIKGLGNETRLNMAAPLTFNVERIAFCMLTSDQWALGITNAGAWVR